MSCRFWLALLLAGLWTSHLSAQIPAGGEFRINSYAVGYQNHASVASGAAGNFVVVWRSWHDQDGSYDGVFGQRYDAAGQPQGGEFRVNTYTTWSQYQAAVAADAAGNFVVVWTSFGQDGNWPGVFARRYDAAGQARGGEFQVNTHTTSSQNQPAVASDAAGNFVVVWGSEDGSYYGVFGRRYDAAGQARGGEFQVNTHTPSSQDQPAVASDAAGNFVVAWAGYDQDGSGAGVFAQRYDAAGQARGGEFRVNIHTIDWQWGPVAAYGPAGDFVVVWASYAQDGDFDGVFGRLFHGRLGGVALAVDQSATAGSDGNGILEPGESVEVKPSWKNVSGQSRTFDGAASSFDGPPGAGVSYQLLDATALYGTADDETTLQCTDCFQLEVQATGTRPATHWDATLVEDLTADGLGQEQAWKLHVGESFTDVPKTSGYYRFVETLLHRGVTGGCSATSYCPANAVTREQMSVFTLAGKEGAAYLPRGCRTWIPVFGDVPANSPFCPWIWELARRGVVSGCGGGNYCPTDAVTREQMSVFLLHTLDPALNPPACTVPVFNDVPASSPFCRWIQELARRGITGGCGGGNYCPTDPITREQMAAFISVTFGLGLYGP
jgi:hypothetical protein